MATRQYFTVIFAGLGSMLAGAAVTHRVFQPRLDLEPLDAESQRRLEAHKAHSDAQYQKVLAAMERGDTDEVKRLLAERLAGDQTRAEAWAAQVEAEDRQRKSLLNGGKSLAEIEHEKAARADTEA